MKRISNHVLAQASSDFPTDWCIAGGYAACPGLAQDCDVWVFADHEYPARKAILVCLEKYKVDYVREENAAHDPIEDYVMGVNLVGNIIKVWKVAKLADGRQVLLTDARSAEDLLNGFDISTHQCALTSDGAFIKGGNWTPINVPPVMIQNTPNSCKRLEKIAKRYGHIRVTI